MTVDEINGFLKAQNWDWDWDWDSAIAASTKLIDELTKSNTPAQNPDALFQAYRARGYARCFTATKDEEYAKAVEDLSMAIALLNGSGSNEQKQAECYAKRAYSYWLSSQYERAIADCEKVKNRTDVKANNIPADIEAFAYELLSQIYTNTGYPIEAAAHSKKALSAQTDSAPHIPSFNLLEQYRLARKKLKGN